MTRSEAEKIVREVATAAYTGVEHPYAVRVRAALAVLDAPDPRIREACEIIKMLLGWDLFEQPSGQVQLEVEMARAFLRENGGE